MLKRVLEPEVMDGPEVAAAYDAMDHAAVNRAFVEDLLRVADAQQLTGQVLDIGAGTARIPIELCRQVPGCIVLAVDLSSSMVELARANVRQTGMEQRIEIQQVDARDLPYEAGRFAAVISNSIVHHIPDPEPLMAEAVRVTAAGGTLFFRDLLRPPDDAAVKRLVRTYAGDATAEQQKMLDDSLRASLGLHEVRAIVGRLGFDPKSVVTTSDRHWTWAVRVR